MFNYNQRIEEMNYWGDPRVRESLITHDSFFVKGSKTTIDLSWVRETWDDWSHYEELVVGDDNWTTQQWKEATETTFKQWLESLGSSLIVNCQSRFEVCNTCQGRGSHVNPSIDAGGITSSEWDEWDYESQENYWSGRYDVTCYECRGEKVTQILEYETTNKLYNWCCERLSEYYQNQYDSAAEYIAEKRMGC